MSVEFYWVFIILLAILFINEHFISKELKITLFREAYLKEVAMSVADDVLAEQVNLDYKIERLQQRLEIYEPESTEEEEHSKSLGS
jgi:hypothetical protein